MKTNGSAATLALAEALGNMVDEAVDRHASIVIKEVGKVRSDVKRLESRIDGMDTRLEAVERTLGKAL